MASATLFDPVHTFAQWPSVLSAVSSVTMVILILTVVIFTYVIMLRIRNNVYERDKAEFREKWRTIIFNWMSGEKIEPVELGYYYQLLLLETWYGIRRLIEDNSAQELNDFATAFQLDQTVADILQYRSYSAENKKVWLQLEAVRVARLMHTEPAIEALLRASDSANFRVNIEATCALVELQHENAGLAVLSSLMQYYHWVPYIVAKVSRAGGSDILHLVGEQMDLMDDQQARNLISLTEASDDRSLLPMLVEILQKTGDAQEQASIIKTIQRLGDHSYVKYIIPFLEKENPVLRLRAVTALGRLGDVNDLKLILPLCADNNWWTRYRAAESYLLISRPDKDGFNRLLDSLADSAARDIFRHVYTELTYA